MLLPMQNRFQSTFHTSSFYPFFWAPPILPMQKQFEHTIYPCHCPGTECPIIRSTPKLFGSFETCCFCSPHFCQCKKGFNSHSMPSLFFYVCFCHSAIRMVQNHADPTSRMGKLSNQTFHANSISEPFQTCCFLQPMLFDKAKLLSPYIPCRVYLCLFAFYLSLEPFFTE